MNKEKLTYLSPETETLVVRFEDSILQAISGDMDPKSWTSGASNWFDDED